MSRVDAANLILIAERLGIKAHTQAHGRGVAMRFTGDHWHVSASSAALALLGEVPTPVSR